MEPGYGDAMLVSRKPTEHLFFNFSTNVRIHRLNNL